MTQPTTKAVIHAICPHCEEVDATLGHLEEGSTFGPWYCDSCGRAYAGVYRGEATKIFKDDKGRRKLDTLVLLEYPRTDKPLRFLIKGRRYVENEDQEYDGSGYFYEEHSCPTNWLKDCAMVAFDGDTDPHGFLRYVREIDCPDLPDNCMEEDEALIQLFPEMLDTRPLDPITNG